MLNFLFYNRIFKIVFLLIFPLGGINFVYGQTTIHSQDFENSASIPTGWTQINEISANDFSFIDGAGAGTIDAAHGGIYNASMYATRGSVTKLVTPALDFSGYTTNPTLEFWHGQELWSADQDELRIYYKTSLGGSWNLISPSGVFTSNVSSWTKRTISLPSVNSTYYIAFEGTSDYGYGIVIDDVLITGTLSGPSITVSADITGLDYCNGSGPSASQTFTVEGSILTNNITLTAPTNFEISEDDVTFSSSIILTQSGGTVNSTTIYARLKSGLATSTYAPSNVAATSTGATTQNVSLSGEVTANPISVDAGSPQNITIGAALNLDATGTGCGTIAQTILEENFEGETTSAIVTTTPGNLYQINNSDCGAATTLNSWWITTGTNTDLANECDNCVNQYALIDYASCNQDFELVLGSFTLTESTDITVTFDYVYDYFSAGDSFDAFFYDGSTKTTLTGFPKIDADAEENDYTDTKTLSSGTYTLRFQYIGNNDYGAAVDNMIVTKPASSCTYSWDGPDSFLSSEEDPQVTSSATGVEAGTYNVTITEGSCSSSDFVIVTGYDNESDIVEADFNEPDNIAYVSKTTVSGLTTSNSEKVGSFTIRDGGSDNTDSDNQNTMMTGISFTISNHEYITALAIFDGATNLSEQTTVGATTAFSGLTIAATDNSTKTFDLYCTFETTVVDNEQVSFTINSVTADYTKSTFAAADAGGATTSITGDDNRIEVTADRFTYTQQPTSVCTSSDISPDIIVTAVDENSNTDLDFTSPNVDITASGGTPDFSPASVDPIDGVATFSGGNALSFSGTGTNLTLTAIKNGGDWDKVSNTFNVGGPPTVTTQAVTLVTGTGATGNGNITSIGGGSISEHGVCWNTGGNPTTANNITTDGAANTGVYTSSITGLSAGSTYYVKAYATNSCGTSYGAEESFVAANANSNIVTADNEMADIDYATKTAVSINGTTDAHKVWSFKIQDGGGVSDADGEPTVLTTITIEPGTSDGVTGGNSWASTIKQAALYIGSTKIKEISVTGETMAFSSFTSGVSAADNGSITVDLYLTFETGTIIDQEQFQFKITNANATAGTSSSSGFNVFADVNSDATDENGKIDVIATKLVYTSGPPTSERIDNDFAISVQAQDDNNNLDIDASGTVTLSEGGTGIISSVTGLTSSFTSGQIAWTDIQYDTEEDNVVITATHSGTYASCNNTLGTDFIDILVIPVGASSTYTTLQTAYDAIKSVAAEHIIELQSDYSDAGETYPIDLGANNSANIVTIRPALGVSERVFDFGIDSQTQSVFEITGATNITIDGRSGGIGSDRNITIRNTQTGASINQGPALQISNDASDITISYCNLESEAYISTLPSNGVVEISACVSTCSDNITISYCKIGDMTTAAGATEPAVGIWVEGDAAIMTSNLNFHHNILYDCLQDNKSYIGYITVGERNENTVINNNIFYRTNNIISDASETQHFIFFRGETTSPTISANFFGGNDADTTDTDEMSIEGAGNFHGIEIEDLVGTATITGNNFKGLTFSNSAASSCVLMDQLTTMNVNNNYFSNLTFNTDDHNIIKHAAASGTHTFNGNTVGSLVANNITWTPNGDCVAIYHFGDADFTCNNNVFQNIKHTNAGVSGQFKVIESSGSSSGKLTCSGNLIMNIESASARNGYDTDPTITGIFVQNSNLNNLISKNIIHDIKSSYTGTGNYPNACGIEMGNIVITGAGTIEKNIIYDIISMGDNEWIETYGISVHDDIEPGDIINIENNVVLLDNNGGTDTKLFGLHIYNHYDGGTLNVLHNTVKVYGSTANNLDKWSYGISIASGSGGGTNSTYVVKNNVIQNTRTTGGTSRHYGLDHYNQFSSFASDGNWFDVTDATYFARKYNTTYANFAAWQAATKGYDANGFSGAITIDAEGHVTSPNPWDGGAIGGVDLFTGGEVEQDFNDVTRAVPWIGAYEGETTLPIELLSFIAKQNEDNNIVEWQTASEYNTMHFIVESSINGIDFSKVNSVNANGYSNTILHYSIYDFYPSDLTYYRLKSIDIDGSFQYSNIVAVHRVRDINNAINYYPNPFKDEITISFDFEEETNSMIRVIDISGRIVLEENSELLKHTLNLTDCPKGVYILQVKIKGRNYFSKIVKQ